MSDKGNPSGKPVTPPIPNIGRKLKAKSIGVLNLIEPPQSEITKHVKITTDGIDIIIVVIEKNLLIDSPIPVKNIWWAQTIKDIKPKNITA